MYRRTNDPDTVERMEDGALIARGHRWWEEYEAWLAGGGVPEDPDTPAPVASVTMRQARLQLLAMGLLATVDAAIASMPGPEGDAARIEWEFADTVERGNPTAEAIIAMLALSDGQVADLFAGASSR